MGLIRNILALMALMSIASATFLLVSYAVSLTVFYTLEYPGDTAISILRVLIGLATAFIWVAAWYYLTRLWLYRILLEGEET